MANSHTTGARDAIKTGHKWASPINITRKVLQHVEEDVLGQILRSGIVADAKQTKSVNLTGIAAVKLTHGIGVVPLGTFDEPKFRWIGWDHEALGISHRPRPAQ